MSITSYERQGTSTKKSPNPASGISRVTSLADAIHSTAKPRASHSASPGLSIEVPVTFRNLQSSLKLKYLAQF